MDCETNVTEKILKELNFQIKFIKIIKKLILVAGLYQKVGNEFIF